MSIKASYAKNIVFFVIIFKILINNRLVIKLMPCRHCIQEEWNEGIDGKWVKMCEGGKCSAFDYTYCKCSCHFGK